MSDEEPQSIFGKRHEFTGDWYTALDASLTRRYSLMGFAAHTVEILVRVALDGCGKAYQKGIEHERHRLLHTQDRK